VQHLNAEERMPEPEPLSSRRCFRRYGWLIAFGLLGACAPRPQGDLAALRRAEIPSGLTDARGRDVSGRALKAYKTSQVRTIEKQHTRADHTLSQLPGVVAVRPGHGVVYVYTSRPAELPAEFEGTPIRALPPEFVNGVSEEWVTPDQLPPLGQGN
jgi:hypothetical protein